MQPTASIILKEWQKITEESSTAYYFLLFFLINLLILSSYLVFFFINISLINPKKSLLNLNKLSYAEVSYDIFKKQETSFDTENNNEVFKKFKLIGILYSHTKNKNNSQVIINFQNKEKFYNLGDSLPGGVIINDIFKNKVKLQYNKIFYEIKLQNDKLPFLHISKPLESNY